MHRKSWLLCSSDIPFPFRKVQAGITFEVRQSFDLDYPAMAGVPEALGQISASGLELVGRFTLPEQDWWDDFYAPMEGRIAQMRERYGDDSEALSVLDRLAQEPAMHRQYSEYYAYEFFVLRLPA